MDLQGIQQNAASVFAEAATSDEVTGRLSQVYATGVMFSSNGVEARIDDTSLGIREGQILYFLTQMLKPEMTIETGFGRGGSAAFLLAGMKPWNGKLISIDPAFRNWSGDTGINYLTHLGVIDNHVLVEEPSEFALADIVRREEPKLKLAYVDGSHHFDGTLFDFMYLDKILEVGGIIGIDDAPAPAVRTVASYIAHNLPYRLHYVTPRLLLCEKMAPLARDWAHFKPFVSSPKADWDLHTDLPSAAETPNTTFDY